MNNALNTYQRQAVLNASPEKLISIIYDGTIAAAYRKDQARLLEGLQILTLSLNFEYDVAKNFYNLYQYCRHRVQVNEFDEVRELLDDIRTAWNEHVVKSKE